MLGCWAAGKDVVRQQAVQNITDVKEKRFMLDLCLRKPSGDPVETDTHQRTIGVLGVQPMLADGTY